MRKELELWQFIAARLERGEGVMLLVVAESSGSSPGRAGHKMAVAADGELFGSIGGGVMEVNLVERCRELLSVPPVVTGDFLLPMLTQVHRKNVENSSGMICSGQQTVIFKHLTPENRSIVESVADAVYRERRSRLRITRSDVGLDESVGDMVIRFEALNDLDFAYSETVGAGRIFIIGGGHCALALSELMSKLDFRISIFDNRPGLNTIEKNKFANEIKIIKSYDEIGEHLPGGDDIYVVVMTLGYTSDKVVIKQLCGRDFKYFGVLGSKAKMATLMKELREEGIPEEQLVSIRTPIGIPINSRTPEEIAISIAAEIIAIKNAAFTSSRSL